MNSGFPKRRPHYPVGPPGLCSPRKPKNVRTVGCSPHPHRPPRSDPRDFDPRTKTGDHTGGPVPLPTRQPYLVFGFRFPKILSKFQWFVRSCLGRVLGPRPFRPGREGRRVDLVSVVGHSGVWSGVRGRHQGRDPLKNGCRSTGTGMGVYRLEVRS